MTPSQQAKQAGLNSLAELQTLSEVPYKTLLNWHKTSENKFKLAIDAALYRQGKR